MQEVAISLVSAAYAECEANGAKDPQLVREAKVAVRSAGDVLLEVLDRVQTMAGLVPSSQLMANPNGRHPSGVPAFLIRTYSSSILAGAQDVYLVVNSNGQVMDAVITDADDFGPLQADYGALSILELDVSGPQFRRLKKLAAKLQQVVKDRPAFRPSRGSTSPGGGSLARVYGQQRNPKRMMR
jgi:hypothetical protein